MQFLFEKTIQVINKRPEKLLALPDIIKAFIFSNRDIGDVGQLDYRIENLEPPYQLKDIDKSIKRLVQALLANEQIVVIGDYDADGATSTALVYLSLKNLGFTKVNFLIPDRFIDGYGLSPNIVTRAKNDFNADLIITVDNGISSFSGVEHANNLGIDVIITDHHLAGSSVPEAVAIINPNQHGCNFPSKNLVGVGVAYYVMSTLTYFIKKNFDRLEQIISLRNAINYTNLKNDCLQILENPALLTSITQLDDLISIENKTNRFVNFYNPEFDPSQYLDLVAIGTIADLATLDYNNRILVEQGIRRIRSGQCLPGITAMLRVQKATQSNFSTEDISFKVAPLINAVGRLDNMTKGLECLLCSDYQRAEQMALEMQRVNMSRSTIQNENTESVQNKFIETYNNSSFTTICLYNPTWHQGVIGLLASYMKEFYWRPAIIFTDEDDNYIKASGRSINSFHLKDCLESISQNHPGLIVRFGGHAGAAGLTIARKDFDKFKQIFEETVRLTADLNDIGKETIYCDLDLPSNYLTIEFARELSRLGPWGKGFPEPIFKGRFKILSTSLVGKVNKDTLILNLQDNNGVEHKAIKFKISQKLLNNISSVMDVYYTLIINRYGGREYLNLLVKHLEPIS